MYPLDRLTALDLANDRRGDIFDLEYPNRWDAAAARHAAELDLLDQRARPTIGRRALPTGLAALRHRFAATPSRLEGVAADRPRSSGSAAR